MNREKKYKIVRSALDGYDLVKKVTSFPRIQEDFIQISKVEARKSERDPYFLGKRPPQKKSSDNISLNMMDLDLEEDQSADAEDSGARKPVAGSPDGRSMQIEMCMEPAGASGRPQRDRREPAAGEKSSKKSDSKPKKKTLKDLVNPGAPRQAKEAAPSMRFDLEKEMLNFDFDDEFEKK